ncbi:MAG: microviridin/marinostatin family tricyclic proteinase inhibitor [Polyangiaceae bacterium]|nr:microviridin/marinostatin family tricyclic proteinase inhibitor [Polyangiaceae bacterium]
MSNKIAESEAGAAPFFANLLSSQKDPAQLAGGGGSKPAPTYHCLDSECTKKYPSDDDESTTWFGDADW